MKPHLVACVVLYIDFLFVLGFQTVAPVLPEPELFGVVAPTETPVLRAASWWDGTFQRRVQGAPGEAGWMDRHAGLRSAGIRTDNQISLSVFDEATPTATSPRDDVAVFGRAYPQGIIVGKDGWLFGEGYVESFLGNDTVAPEQIRRWTADLRRLQDELDRRGIVLLVVVSPSKLPLYPEYLPDWLLQQREVMRQRHPGRKTNYEVLRPLLDEQGVRWIDGIARLREEKQRQEDVGREYRLFTSGGTHWSEYGASLIAETMLARLKELTGKDLTQMNFWNVSIDRETTGTDNDLGDLLNLWTPSACKGVTAHPHLIRTLGRWRPDVLWVGGSFSYTLTDMMDLFQVYRQRETLFMFSTRFTYPDGTDNLLKDVPLDWSEELLSRDVVVIETNESQIDMFGYGFVEAALEFLDGQPPPPRGPTAP